MAKSSNSLYIGAGIVVIVLTLILFSMRKCKSEEDYAINCTGKSAYKSLCCSSQSRNKVCKEVCGQSCDRSKNQYALQGYPYKQ
jgi:hypothetical protein